MQYYVYVYAGYAGAQEARLRHGRQLYAQTGSGRAGLAPEGLRHGSILYLLLARLSVADVKCLPTERVDQECGPGVWLILTLLRSITLPQASMPSSPRRPTHAHTCGGWPPSTGRPQTVIRRVHRCADVELEGRIVLDMPNACA